MPKEEQYLRKMLWIESDLSTWTWRLFNAALTALNVLSPNDGETLRECGRDACVARWGECDRGERILNVKKKHWCNIWFYSE